MILLLLGISDDHAGIANDMINVRIVTHSNHCHYVPSFKLERLNATQGCV